MVGERSPNDPRPAKARPIGTIDKVVADDGSVELWRIFRRSDPAEEDRLVMLRRRLKHIIANKADIKEPYPGHTDEIIETYRNDIRILEGERERQ